MCFYPHFLSFTAFLAIIFIAARKIAFKVTRHSSIVVHDNFTNCHSHPSCHAEIATDIFHMDVKVFRYLFEYEEETKKKLWKPTNSKEMPFDISLIVIVIHHVWSTYANVSSLSLIFMIFFLLQTSTPQFSFIDYAYINGFIDWISHYNRVDCCC